MLAADASALTSLEMPAIAAILDCRIWMTRQPGNRKHFGLFRSTAADLRPLTVRPADGQTVRKYSVFSRFLVLKPARN